MERVLVVDDDEELCELVAEYLEPEGFTVTAAHDGAAGIQHALAGAHDLVILDVMLPEKTGFDVLRSIRSAQSTASAIPILMLTARGDHIDRIVGLELGADDYLPKPFHPRELVARIHAVLRRVRPEPNAPPPVRERLSVGDVELDVGARETRRAGASIVLTAIEFDLLAALLRVAGRVVTREEIARDVFDRKFLAYDRSIDMHVSNLRKKLGRRVDGVERIKTVRGVGYIYALPNDG